MRTRIRRFAASSSAGRQASARREAARQQAPVLCSGYSAGRQASAPRSELQRAAVDSSPPTPLRRALRGRARPSLRDTRSGIR
jgi:hypothetical protein